MNKISVTGQEYVVHINVHKTKFIMAVEKTDDIADETSVINYKLIEKVESSIFRINTCFLIWHETYSLKVTWANRLITFETWNHQKTLLIL